MLGIRYTDRAPQESADRQAETKTNERRARRKATIAAAGGHARWLRQNQEREASAQWARWLLQNGNDPVLALAEAVRTLNRAIKVGRMAAPSTAGRTPLLSGEERERAYKVKDEWIRLSQRYLTDGKIAREETSWNGQPSRVLYVHTFAVHAKMFCFHSYQAPVLLSEERAEDLPTYGTSMSEAEWAAMRMSGAQLLRMVRHGMALNKGVDGVEEKQEELLHEEA